MSEMQAIPPPPGGDHDRGPDTYGVVISMTILSTAFVLARMYARIKIIRNVGWDDHTIVLAQLMNLLNFIFQILAVRNGLGRHMYYLSLQQIVNVGLHFHIIEILYVLNTAVIKISACLFLLRILARGTSKSLRWVINILMGILLVLCIATAIVILIQCNPIQAGWDPRIKGRCWSYPQTLGIGYAQNAWAIVSDLACAGFPIIILRKLKINNRNKYALCSIMALGLLSGICCVVKIIYLGNLANGDFTYNGVNVNMWGVLETNFGTIACCAPALQPLFKSLSERSTMGSHSKGAARNTPAAQSWRDSTANKFGSRNRNFHSIKNDTSSDSDQQILSTEDAKGIRKTTDVEFFFHDAGSVRPAKDGPIEMV